MKGQFILPDHWRQSIRFRLDEALVFQDHTVPAGYITDGATVPRSLVVFGLAFAAAGHWHWGWFIPAVMMLCAVPLFPRFGRTLRAAVLHDYLLTDTNVSWQWANWRFFVELERQGITFWRCLAMYAAVTLYQAGIHAFKKSPTKGKK